MTTKDSGDVTRSAYSQLLKKNIIKDEVGWYTYYKAPLPVSLRMVAKKQHLAFIIALAAISLIALIYLPHHVDGYTPPTCSLTDSPGLINPPQTSTSLTFSSANGSQGLTSCSISGVGGVGCNTTGSVSVSPTNPSTTYTFTASDGTEPCTATANVVFLPDTTNLAGSQLYTTPGTYTFTVPSIYTYLSVQLWGGGGGGGGGAFAPSYGGGGGGYSYTTYNSGTLPSTVTVTVGSGGAGGGSSASTGGCYGYGSAAAGTPGTPSVFGSYFSAAGGGAGAADAWGGNPGPYGGSGGAGTVENGGTGGGNQSASTAGVSTACAGAGGGSNDYAGPQYPGGTSSCGGSGGASGTSPGGVGNQGDAPGGGGGGGGDTYSNNCSFSVGAAGANGANGEAYITWKIIPSCTISLSPNPMPFGSGSRLTYSSTDATSFYINNVGYVSGSGSVEVSPTMNTDYTGTATYGSISNTCPATLTVTPSVLPIASIAASSTSIQAGNSTNITADFRAGASQSVSSTPVVVYLTSGSTWTVPSGWNSLDNKIEVIGGGGSGPGSNGGNNGTPGAGGGGEYAEITNVPLSSGATLYYSIGSGGTSGAAGGATWLRTDGTNQVPTSISNGVLANGGGAGTNCCGTGGGAGGAGGTGGIGNALFDGGAGGAGSGAEAAGGPGGGGAGGPNGTGGTGGNSNNGVFNNMMGLGGAGGGGNGGGSVGSIAATAGGAYGGNNISGTGGGAGGTNSGNGANGTSGGGGGGAAGGTSSVSGTGGTGGTGNEWGSYGSGGGGGGSATGAYYGYGGTGGSGGLYGGGGGSGGEGGAASGSGAHGLIVITYYQQSTSTNPDSLTGDNIDEPYGTGLGATTNPDASKTIIFTPSLPGTYTFYAMAHSVNYPSWAGYASTTITVIANPSCTLSASPTAVTQGSPSTLSYSSANSSGFSINHGVGSETANTPGTVSVTPTQTTTYTGSAVAGGVTNTCTATVNVSCQQSWSCNGSTIVQTNTDCSTTNLATCSSPAYCQAGSSSCLVPAINPVATNNLTGNLQIIPNIVSSGETSKVYWNVADAQFCNVVGTNGDSWAGLSGNATTSPITSPVTYKLSCTAYSPNPNLIESQTVTITPKFLEQ